MRNPLARRRFLAPFLLLALLWPCWIGWGGVAAAEASRAEKAAADAKPEDGPAPDEIKAGLTAIKQRLDAGDLTPALLSRALGEVTALRQQAMQCQQTGSDQLSRVEQALAAVGVKQEGETPELAETRRKIEAFKAKAEGRRAECRLHIVFADSLIMRIDAAQKTLLTKRLTERGPGILELTLWNLRNPQAWSDAGLAVIAGRFGLRHADPVAIALLLAMAAAGLGFGRWARRRLSPRLVQPPEPIFSARLVHGILAAVARDAAPLAAALGAALALGATDMAAGALGFKAIFCCALAGFLTARVLIRGLLDPYSPARLLLGINDGAAHQLIRSLNVLAGTIALGTALLFAPVQEGLPREAHLFARALFIAILVIDLGWLTALIGRMPRLRQTGRVLRLVLVAALALILLAELMGYRNLSSYLLQGLTGTSVLAAAFWLIGAFVAEVCAGLDGADAAWSAQLRGRMGLAEEEGFPGLVWLRLLLTVSLWIGGGILMLRAWGLSDTGSALVLGYLVDGIAIGDVKFVPTQVLSGAVVFFVLLALARWLRNWVETKWLRHSRMDRGAKDALVTITGYCGVVIAVLFGLSSAGVALSNLALIASALSVGIGFGLQNIVSNFVAGLILLFERPIKTGDWVVVGGTEGIVKRIRVRATEIRTFERSDVAVPNSELITAHVKNWTLRDRVGRATIPIGVAYGSDTELVRDLLLAVAHAHEGIVQETKGDPIKVLFRGFGECALDFELSFTVRNVDERSDVVSDVNFAIDKAFRAHRVEIPYPQHEVRIRGWEEDGTIPLSAILATPGKKGKKPAPPPRAARVQGG
ncbi:MAG: mechanosensitive ion channel family protein [Alphaproteobacteria bacterium]|nr:mechanosensitive ion channel family protein [Alphaproteobacteria bacterium]